MIPSRGGSPSIVGECGGEGQTTGTGFAGVLRFRLDWYSRSSGIYRFYRFRPTPWRIRLAAYGARLESGLGASPQGFESPILRKIILFTLVRTYLMLIILQILPQNAIRILSHNIVFSCTGYCIYVAFHDGEILHFEKTTRKMGHYPSNVGRTISGDDATCRRETN